MKTAILISAGLAALLSGCRQGAETKAPTSEEIQAVSEAGKKAAESLMTSLGGQLKAALETGGPVNAMRVCQQVAGPLTEAADKNFEEGSIRRTSLKVRNPKNAPDEMDRQVLENLASAEELPASHVEWSPGAARFYKPLVMQEICLKCHGDPATYPAELTTALAELYPSDQASGYRLGDLRGVIRVDIPRQ